MTVLWDGFLQGLNGVWVVARVVIPLMVVLEIAQRNGLLQRLNKILARPFKIIGLSEEGAFPVVVAIIFGITFGSGVILNHVRQGKVSQQEIQIVGTFMALAHALIEDTILFMTLGAPLLFLLVPRLAAAYFLSYLAHKRGSKFLTQGEHRTSVN